MADVARHAGVSVKTVSNVVNDYPHIRPGTKEKVEASLSTLGYRMNVSARHLRTRRSGLITLAVPELSLPYFAELADAVIEEAGAHGLTVLIEQTGGRRERELDALSGSRRQLTDGLIISPLGLEQPDRAAFEVDFPLVVLGERIFGATADHVTMNNVAAARAATEHLIALGRRRIAVVGSIPGDTCTGSAGLRLSGYRDALAGAGIAFDPALVVPAAPWHRSAGADSLGALLDAGTPVDAVFALNDALALGALYALHARDVDVPRDVALIGFDDVDDVRYATPTISSVAPGRDEIARTAVALLRSRLAGDDGPYVRVISEAHVVARQSTGSAAEHVVSVQPGSQVPADAPV
ncbi:LacI family transcriptional regulator [Ruania suaedae]|uniref:LacI family DNA-binding transcriptional regulator n=1 Tax=Ruania suaedae TaxID=2897774 RepID=UPI001E5793C2|nr:LacI family DNA-binding transcriptional regulator [Ruania suaedae]UFU04658.1 LacI family transcriptional regulator [Ruania suaedae]